ncbi:flagellin [Salinibacter ruber]|uniref:flagellin N-terminal helical domain-containing protein n=1 Tax=Salinibacter ruber TaxID=146919 RepID=UPI00207334D1|nr:flagellin [Salinibacter ruber]
MSSFSQINTNIQAQQAFQNLSDTSEQLADTRERLSTGLRINSASDDAAGFEIAEGLEARTGSQQQALRNIGDAKSALSVAEGGLDSQLNILQSAREKAVQAANGSLSQNERNAIAGELQEQVSEINDIAENTTFNGDKLIKGGTSGDDGNSVGLTFQTGSESDQTFDVDIQNSTARDLGIGGDFDPTKAASTTNTGGQSVDSDGDFADAEVDTQLEGNITVDTNGGDFAGSLKGGTFEVQVTDTDTSDTNVTFQVGGQSFTASAGASGDTTFTGGSNVVLSETTGGNKIQFTLTNAVGFGPDDVPSGGKSFTVEVKDTDNIGKRLEGSGGDTARNIIDDVDSAINSLTSQLSDLGASQNRLSFKESNLETSQTNLQAAQSRIQDADFAKEQTQAAKLQVQQQSGTAQLAQANAAGQSVLSLLQ